MQILFPGWPLPRLGLPGLGPMRTGWAESQEVSMGGHHPHEVTGAPAEREGEGRSPTALLTRLLKHQRRMGQAFTFHSVRACVLGMGKPCNL